MQNSKTALPIICLIIALVQYKCTESFLHPSLIRSSKYHHHWDQKRQCYNTFHQISTPPQPSLSLYDSIKSPPPSSQFEDEIDINYEINDKDGTINPQRLISESATLDLPFSSEIAFDAFADLPRQPSWSPWLRSVSYIGDFTSASSATLGRPEESRWILRVKGLTLGWKAVATALERPNVIKWESTSGVKNMGTVDIVPMGDNQCRMTLTMNVVVPRALAALFRRSSRIGVVFREKFLMTTLVRFRDVVLEEDVGGLKN